MANVNFWNQSFWLRVLDNDRARSFPIAADDLWGMPMWLFITIAILLALALLAWFLLGADLKRYLRIRNM